VTPRAVCVGLLAGMLVNLVMAYNDFYLQNTLLIGNHFPTTSIAVVFVLALGVNVVLRRWSALPAFSPGELLLIWGMIGVAGGIGSAGLMRYLPSWIVLPAYYVTAGNEYGTHVVGHIPAWMLVSKDGNAPAVRWFMEGLPAGATIPWGPWVRPLALWLLFIAFLWSVLFAGCAVLYRQWAEDERLIFPIVHLPAELAAGPPGGRTVNEFLSNRLTWIGILAAVAILGWNNVRAYMPGLPAVPLSWSTWGLFPDRPWSEFNMGSANLYCSVVGLTFLLTTEIAFSLWFFFFLYRLSFVYIAWLGAGATGYWGSWSTRVPAFDGAGAVLVLAGFILWAARRALWAWLVRGWRGADDPEREIMPPRLAACLVAAGGVGMAVWLLAAGVQWWACLAAIVLYLAVLLVLTRLVAEAGLLFVQTNVMSPDVLQGLFPASWFSGPTLSVLMIHKAVHMNDLREILTPYIMNGLRAGEAARLHLRKVLLVFAATALIATAISAYARITTYYKYGGVNMDQWANVWSATWWMEGMARYRRNPPTYDFVRLGERRVLPVDAAHVVTGGAVAAAMLWMRSRFLWWPLHPFGMVLVGAYAMNSIWFSIFLGWACKSTIMTFGGARTYRRLLPLFLGFVLGEGLVSAGFTFLSMLTGVPTEAILPR